MELREAERRLQAAQATMERARTEAQPLPEVADSATFDVQLLQQSVATARAQVETIERELTATRLRAPFAGTVVTVSVRSGDPIEPGQPAIVLTKPGTRCCAPTSGQGRPADRREVRPRSSPRARTPSPCRPPSRPSAPPSPGWA